MEGPEGSEAKHRSLESSLEFGVALMTSCGAAPGGRQGLKDGGSEGAH